MFKNLLLSSFGGIFFISQAAFSADDSMNFVDHDLGPDIHIIDLKPAEGSRISDIILKFASDQSIRIDKTFVSWDFDDTLASHIKDPLFISLVALRGHFTDGAGYDQFRNHTKRILFYAGMVDTSFENFIAEGHPEHIKTSYQRFFDAKLPDQYNDLPVEVKVSLSELLRTAILSFGNLDFGALYIPRDASLKRTLNTLQENNIKMGILTNGDAHHAELKQNMLNAFFKNVDLKFNYTNDANGCEIKSPLLFQMLETHIPPFSYFAPHSVSSYLSSYIKTPSKRLVVHIDDKRIEGTMRTNGGDGPLPQMPSNTTFLYIRWDRPQFGNLQQSFNNDMLERGFAPLVNFIHELIKRNL
jgi:hypothetical protein